MLKVIRTKCTRELWRGNRQVFLAVIGDGWGECDEEVAEREMQEALDEFQRAAHSLLTN